MDKLKKAFTVGIPTAITLAVVLWVTLAERGRKTLLFCLSDGFLLAAALFLLAGGILLLGWLGLFDWFGYLIRKTFRRADAYAAGKGKTQKKLTYYTYKASVKHEKTGFLSMLLWAAGTFLCSLALFLLGSLVNGHV